MISHVTYKGFGGSGEAGLEVGKKYEVVEIKEHSMGATVIIRENACTTVTCHADDFYEKEEILKEVGYH